MSDEVIIRDVQTSDVGRLVEIAIEAWAPYFKYCRQKMGEELFAQVHPDWRAEKGQLIRDACRPDKGDVAVAEVAGTVVGFITFYTEVAPGVGAIDLNAVHPDFQRRGIGTRLCTHALERLRAAGARVARVGTGLDPAYAPARRTYEKAGFEVGLECIVYYRSLSPGVHGHGLSPKPCHTPGAP